MRYVPGVGRAGNLYLTKDYNNGKHTVLVFYFCLFQANYKSNLS